MSPLAVLGGAGWRVVFEQHLDRIRHSVEVQSADGWCILAESVEGESSAWWPPSPPLQSVHVEPRLTGSVALLVGMAGRSHWSASVEIAGDGEKAVFDMACRAAATPDWLGCRYRAPAQQPMDGRQDVLRVGRHEIHFRGLNPWPKQIARDGESGIEIGAMPTTHHWPQTIRWRYAIRVLNGPEGCADALAVSDG